MTTPTHPVAVPRSLLTRLLQMILLAIAFQIAITVLGAVALVQLVLAAFAGGSNARLRQFGRSLGRYLAQIASFETFASEELPFPFAEWPVGD
jgi:hypothetical protein